MGQLEDMAMFVRIVEAGSITKAAEQLNIAKSAVSRRLKDLEARLGSQLISRTTRQSHLTQAGEQYYQQVNNILNAVDAVNEQAYDAPARIEGTLKITAPLTFGLMHLNDVIDEYAAQHPNLEFELDFSDRHVDLIEEGYELAIRIKELQDSSYQAKRLALIRYALCASPDYLKKMGTPDTLEDLEGHEFLQYGLSKTSNLELTVFDIIDICIHKCIHTYITLLFFPFASFLIVVTHCLSYVSRVQTRSDYECRKETDYQIEMQAVHIDLIDVYVAIRQIIWADENRVYKHCFENNVEEFHGILINISLSKRDFY